MATIATWPCLTRTPIFLGIARRGRTASAGGQKSNRRAASYGS
jgi:hypothetical protein